MSSSDAAADPSTDVLDDLSLLHGLPGSVAELLKASVVGESYAFGEEVVCQGEQSGGLYIVVSGRLRAVHEEQGRECALGVLAPGEIFGEAGLLEGEPSPATVRASAACEVLRLEVGMFSAIVRLYPEVGRRIKGLAQMRWRGPLLRTHPIFAALPGPAIDALALDLEERAEREGTVIFRAGDPAGPLFLLVEGRVRVQATDGRTLRYLHAGDIFGELSVYNGAPRSATVVASTEVRFVVLPADVFARLLADHPELRERVDEQIAIYERGPSRAVPLDFVDELVRVDEPRVLDTPALEPVPDRRRPWAG